MLRNRNVNSIQQKASAKKQDHLELLTILDKCTQILRDDRILLRNAVKEQQNQKLIDLLTLYRKKVKPEDFSELQIELRKFINELKGKPRMAVSPERDFAKKKSTQQKENVCVSPSMKQNYDKGPISARKVQGQSPSNDNLNTHSVKKQSQVTLHRNTERELEQGQTTPQKEKDDQLQFMTVVSQSPHTMSINNHTEAREVSQDVILKYNVEEINAFREGRDDETNQDEDQLDDEDKILPSARTILTKRTEGDQEESHLPTESNEKQSEQSYQALDLPVLDSLYFRDLINNEYQGMFTDWSKILPESHFEYYKQTQKHPLILPEAGEQLSVTSYQFTIHGIQPDTLFQILFPTKYFRKLNSYQMRVNLEQALPSNAVDTETLFRICDNDNDGWVHPEDVGPILENCCEVKEVGQELLLIEGLQKGNDCITLSALQDFMKARALEGKIQENEGLDLAEKLFDELDLNNRGYLTKWDLLHCTDIQQVQRILYLF